MIKCFLFLIFPLISQQLMIVLQKNHQLCIDKEIDSDDTIKISFIFSGNKQDVNEAILKGPHSLIHYSNKLENKFKPNDDFSLKVQYAGTYYFCFTSNDDYSSVVSFEFITLKESGHLLEIAKGEVLDDIYKNITQVSYLFEEIEKNLNFYIERKDTHSKLINDIINLIQKLSFYKILIIILLAILQIYIIKHFFKLDKRIFISDNAGKEYII
jgi:hypothetical protein